MKLVFAALATLLLEGCHAQPDNDTAKMSIVASVGTACGVPDLNGDVKGNELSLFEERDSGSVCDANSNPIPAPASARQQRIQAALSCLETQAARRGLTIYYPVTELEC